MSSIDRQKSPNPRVTVDAAALSKPRREKPRLPWQVPTRTTLGSAEREQHLKKGLYLRGWQPADGGRDAIVKEYLMKDFTEAFSFISRLALLAEKHEHYPEMHNLAGKVTLTLTSAEEGGLTMRDVQMARVVDAIPYAPRVANLSRSQSSAAPGGTAGNMMKSQPNLHNAAQ